MVGVGSLEMTNDYIYYPAGQVSNVTSIAGSMTYTYDAGERVTNLDDSAAGSFDYTYDDDNGLVASVEYANDIAATYTYDVMDRVTGIEYSKSGSVLEGLVYTYNDATGMITDRSRDSRGIVYETEYTYDTLDRLTVETLKNATGAVLDTATYAYDLSGNRTNKNRNGISIGYTLGDNNNLLSSWSASGATSAVITVSGSSTETVGTDPRFGERTINDLEAEASGTNFWHLAVPLSTGEVDLVAAIGDLAGNVGSATNSITLTIVTDASYGYDDAGNVTNISYNSGDQELNLGWNAQYQLVAATNGTEVEIYQYDALGRRVATVTRAVTNYHIYDGVHCVADVDHAGDLVRTYTYGPGIDNILAMTVHGSSETNTFYYLTDRLGSVLAITDTNGAVVESYDYDAWGRVQVYDADNLPMSESGIGNRIGFQGREVSCATGLYFFRARWYDPVTGRWLSKDPIGISGGLNQYVAFGNNPVYLLDVFGLAPGDSYNSYEDTLKDAARDAYALTRNGGKYRGKQYGPGVEWGGRIYHNNEQGFWSYTDPVTSGQRRYVRTLSAPIPDGATDWGSYHTHPGVMVNGNYVSDPQICPFPTGSRDISHRNRPGDIQNAMQSGKPVAVVNGDKDVWLFVPNNPVFGATPGVLIGKFDDPGFTGRFRKLRDSGDLR